MHNQRNVFTQVNDCNASASSLIENPFLAEDGRALPTVTEPGTRLTAKEAKPFEMESLSPAAEQMLPTPDMKLVELAPLIAASTTVLGEGASAKVLAVDAPQFPRACIKVFKEHAEPAEALQEATALHSLRHVAGIPRLLAYCRQPVAFLMTRHGSCSLSDIVAKKTGVRMSKTLFCDILR